MNVVGGSGAITALNGADPFGIATPGDLTINAGAPLTASQNVVLRADHTISNNDTVTARNGAVTFTAGSGDINNSSAVAGAGNVLFSAAGNISNSGVDAAGSATLTAGNNIVNNASGIIARGSFASLSATKGDITDMGGVSAQTTASLTAGGSFNQTGGTITAPISVTVLANNGAISQGANGTIKVSGLAGQVSLTAQSDIDLKGTVTAPDTAGASGVVNIRSNAGAITDKGVIRGNGVTLNAAGSISVAGLLSGAATVNLISGESIDEPGTLIADLLTGSAAGDASLTGTPRRATG